MKNPYIKSPLNYVGGKFKLLPEIIPLFPTSINTFVDLFGGGGNLSVNVCSERVVYNDICEPVVELLQFLKENSIEYSLQYIDTLVSEYQLSKENQKGYLQFRNYYNRENKHPLVFYTMICYAFNYQIRFNKNGDFNMPFGKDRSSFNPVLREKFITFCDKLKTLNIKFSNRSFIDLRLDKLGETDFIYADPPYFSSVASYNEQNGWTEVDEKNLLTLLDEADKRGVRFALSNNLKYDNAILKKWLQKYNVHYLQGNYSNCNYHKIDRSKDCEVLITNY